MTHGSLFSGIGGFDLAAEWMGWENKFHCEWNPFCQRVLKYYWPDAKSYGDIDNTDFTIWRGLIDVLSGGFPCQPYSTAGKRKGKEDDRHKWPQMLRAIREIQPGYVVGENVRGLTNWNGGLVFDEVQADLETEGYEVLPFLLPACGVNAPHRRDRIWFVAHSCSNGHQWRGFGKNKSAEGESEGDRDKREWVRDNANGDDESGIIAHAEIQRERSGTEEQGQDIERPEQLEGSESWRDNNNDGFGGVNSNAGCQGLQGSNIDERPVRFEPGTWDNWPQVEPCICRGNDGLPSQMDGITISIWRQKSIEAFGNAIVPQLAYQIFKAIEQVNNNSI